jgi:hypothetical protein
VRPPDLCLAIATANTVPPARAARYAPAAEGTDNTPSTVNVTTTTAGPASLKRRMAL